MYCKKSLCVFAGTGGRRPYPFRRRPGGHRHGIRFHHPYPSRYRPDSHWHYYPHRPGSYGHSPVQGLNRRTARTRYRPASAAPGGTCRISSYDYYNRYPEDIVCRCCISLNYEFCIYDYNCYGTGILGRSRSGRSRHRSYRSRLGARGKNETFCLRLFMRFWQITNKHRL